MDQQRLGFTQQQSALAAQRGDGGGNAGFMPQIQELNKQRLVALQNEGDLVKQRNEASTAYEAARSEASNYDTMIAQAKAYKAAHPNIQMPTYDAQISDLTAKRDAAVKKIQALPAGYNTYTYNYQPPAAQAAQTPAPPKPAVAPAPAPTPTTQPAPATQAAPPTAGIPTQPAAAGAPQLAAPATSSLLPATTQGPKPNLLSTALKTIRGWFH